MSSLAEQIYTLQNAISTGTKSVTIGEMSVSYHSVEEMIKALAFLKAQQSSSEATMPFNVIQVNYNRGY